MKESYIVRRPDYSSVVIQITGYLFITFFALACLIPFVIVVSSSFTSEKWIMKHGFGVWPGEISTLAYKIIFENPAQILGAYLVTVCLTVVGTVLGLFIIAMTGYALQRPDFPYRNKLSFLIYFTTLFSGGVVPYYLLIAQYLHLKDNYLSVLLPSLMSPFLIIMMKTFIRSIPHEITESAKIDGAGDFMIFLKLILPMSVPALATIGLFQALWYWNEWYNALLFLGDVTYKPLQLFLYQVITQADFIQNSSAAANIPPQDIPGEAMKMATAVISTGPVVLFYPFAQRYFIKGITIGAVKG